MILKCPVSVTVDWTYPAPSDITACVMESPRVIMGDKYSVVSALFCCQVEKHWTCECDVITFPMTSGKAGPLSM
jgi:hypothetical protein